MHRYAGGGGRRVKARTGSRCQRVQDAQPHRQRRCACHTRLPVIKRAHHTVRWLDGLGQGGMRVSRRRGTP